MGIRSELSEEETLCYVFLSAVFDSSLDVELLVTTAIDEDKAQCCDCNFMGSFLDSPSVCCDDEPYVRCPQCRGALIPVNLECHNTNLYKVGIGRLKNNV